MRRPVARRGTTLAIVLWVLLAMGALTVTTSLSARLDLTLARAWREHAAALALAETGVAEALARIAAGEVGGEGTGEIGAGTWRASWGPASGGVRIEATGRRGGASRTVEAVAAATVAGGWRVAAWREIR